MDLSASRVLAALAVTASLAVAVLLVAERPDPWARWRPATCMPGNCFCEAPREQLVRQPAATLSSLAFVPIAVLVLGAARRRSGSNLLHSSPVLPYLFGGALALIGLGSAFFHASLTFAGQTVDVLGMYLIATFVVVYGAVRLLGLAARAAAVAYVAGNAGLLVGLMVVPEARRYVFALLVAVGLAVEWRARRRARVRADARILGAAAAMLAAGFAIWSLDLTGLACDPASPLQGHAAWHVLAAVSAGLLFLYYASEGAA